MAIGDENKCFDLGEVEETEHGEYCYTTRLSCMEQRNVVSKRLYVTNKNFSTTVYIFNCRKY